MRGVGEQAMESRGVQSEPGIVLGAPDRSMEKPRPGDDDGGTEVPRKRND
jgi:hypothetical protein